MAMTASNYRNIKQSMLTDTFEALIKNLIINYKNSDFFICENTRFLIRENIGLSKMKKN